MSKRRSHYDHTYIHNPINNNFFSLQTWSRSRGSVVACPALHFAVLQLQLTNGCSAASSILTSSESWPNNVFVVLFVKKELNCKRKFYAIIINYARDNVARFFTTFLIVVYCRHQCCFYSSCKKEECPVCHIKVKFIYLKKLRLFMLKKFKYF